MRFIDKENTPHEWTSQRISHYVEEHKGGAPLRPSDFSESGFPVIPKKAIQQGNKLVISKPTFCTKSFADKNTRSIVDTNYTITTLRDLVPTGPTIGTVVNFYSDEQYILSQGVYGLKLKSNIDRDYFAYVSNAAFYRKVMKRVMVGSTQVHIRTPEYLSLEIQLPPLPEQRKIATILGTWDKAISTTERLIDNSKQQKKALMQQLLTGAHTQRKRLLDDSGKPFEDEWEEVKLGDVCSKVTDGAHHSPKSVEVGYPMFSVKDMRPTGFAENTARHISEDDFKALEKQNCKPETNDILIAKDGSILKYCFVVEEEIQGVILSSIALLRPNLNKITPHFIAQYFSQESVRFFVGKALTSGSGVPRIILKDFKGIHLRIPCLLEQQKIASVLSNADKEIKLLEQQLADLKQEKKALMQQLLTGKRRVKVDDEALV